MYTAQAQPDEKSVIPLLRLSCYYEIAPLRFTSFSLSLLPFFLFSLFFFLYFVSFSYTSFHFVSVNIWCRDICCHYLINNMRTNYNTSLSVQAINLAMLHEQENLPIWKEVKQFGIQNWLQNFASILASPSPFDGITVDCITEVLLFLSPLFHFPFLHSYLCIFFVSLPLVVHPFFQHSILSSFHPPFLPSSQFYSFSPFFLIIYYSPVNHISGESTNEQRQDSLCRGIGKCNFKMESRRVGLFFLA